MDPINSGRIAWGLVKSLVLVYPEVSKVLLAIFLVGAFRGVITSFARNP